MFWEIFLKCRIHVLLSVDGMENGFEEVIGSLNMLNSNTLRNCDVALGGIGVGNVTGGGREVNSSLLSSILM